MMQISSALMVKKKAVANMAMKIGYIQEIDLQLNPQCKERFRFREASFTRRISSRGDRVYSKMLALPVDYEEIVDNANISCFAIILFHVSKIIITVGITYMGMYIIRLSIR